MILKERASLRRKEPGMANTIDLGSGLELRDASDRTVGVLTPPGTIRELEAERDRLRAEVVGLQAERDEYRRALFALTRKEVTFTPEELSDLEADGVSLREIIDQLTPAAHGQNHA